MLVARQASKQKQMVLLALIVIVNGFVGYLVYYHFGPKRRAIPSDVLPVSETSLEVSGNIAAIETLTQDFDRALLDSGAFRMLEKYGAWPVEGAATGRTNPFLPAFGP